MQAALDTTTSVTLLLRLRDLRDLEAWASFVDRYGPKVYGWCRTRGLQDTDAQDVTQTVLAKLVEKIHQFEYNRSRGTFRAWLKTVTHHAIADLAGNWARDGRGSGDDHIHDRLAQAEARDELADVLQAEADREVLHEAEERVKLRVQTHTWRAYELAMEGLPAPDIARALGISVDQVYLAKSRVLGKIRQELEGLGDADIAVRSASQEQPVEPEEHVSSGGIPSAPPHGTTAAR